MDFEVRISQNKKFLDKLVTSIFLQRLVYFRYFYDICYEFFQRPLGIILFE
jgi:hypothetical protein